MGTRAGRVFMLLLALVGALVADSAQAETHPLRTWRSRKGASVDARFVKVAGNKVVLATEDGKPVGISLSSLSAQDRQYIAGVRQARHRGELQRPSGLSSSGSEERSDTISQPLEAAYLSEFEIAVIEEMNRARVDPVGYARYVEEHRARHIGDGVFACSRGRTESKEGLAAVDEAIAFLKEEADAVSALAPSETLSRAARRHVADIGSHGLVGHEGSDGSTVKMRVEREGAWEGLLGENISFGLNDAREVVVQLIVDDGVPGRGHRTNIFNGSFRVAGVAMGSHLRYQHCCGIVYAGGVKGE